MYHILIIDTNALDKTLLPGRVWPREIPSTLDIFSLCITHLPLLVACPSAWLSSRGTADYEPATQQWRPPLDGGLWATLANWGRWRRVYERDRECCYVQCILSQHKCHGQLIGFLEAAAAPPAPSSGGRRWIERLLITFQLLLSFCSGWRMRGSSWGITAPDASGVESTGFEQ